MSLAILGAVALVTFAADPKPTMPAWVEPDMADYAGVYSSYGNDGRERFISSQLTLRLLEKGWVGTWRSAVGMNGVETQSGTVELTNLKVTAEGFTADSVTPKKTWPGYMPAKFIGWFVTTPPPKKGKAAVKVGIQLADKKFLIKKEQPKPKPAAKDGGW